MKSSTPTARGYVDDDAFVFGPAARAASYAPAVAHDQAVVDAAPLNAAGLIAAVSEIAATVATRTLAERPPAVVRVPYPVPAPIEVRIPAPGDTPAPVDVAVQQPGRRLFTRAELVCQAGLASSWTAAVTTVATLLFNSPWTLLSPLFGLLTSFGAAIVMHYQDPGPGRHVIAPRVGVDRHGRAIAESGAEHLLASASLRAIEGGRS